MASNKNNRGFTLVELAVVVVIIGVLAAFAVPRFLKSVERSKASEAFSYLATIRTAQEHYHARQSEYAADLADLDTQMDAPEYFTVGAPVVPLPEVDFQTGWEVTLTRAGSSAGYGAYTVVFDHNGYNATGSTIVDEINPMQTP